MKRNIIYILNLVGLSTLFICQPAEAQLYQISKNEKDTVSNGTTHPEEYQDTVFVVYKQPFRNDSISYNFKIITPETNRRLYFEYERSFPNHAIENSKIALKHDPLPKLSHQVYFVETIRIDPKKVILEKEKSFDFWKETNYHRNNTLIIMVEDEDWESQCNYLVGRQASLELVLGQ